MSQRVPRAPEGHRAPKLPRKFPETGTRRDPQIADGISGNLGLGQARGRGVILEVLEVDILWPRWVARIGVTRSTEACFLTADRQCTELPLLRLPLLLE